MNKIRIVLYAGLPVLILLFMIICWGINLVKFAHCDFEYNYRCEITHGLGVAAPPMSTITAWFDTDVKETPQ